MLALLWCSAGVAWLALAPAAARGQYLLLTLLAIVPPLLLVALGLVVIACALISLFVPRTY